ncbi:MAG: J domain-containing protein [Deltaproteobacteria bacterium]|jgi:curved DNA-binding protein CbpA|nr:J domain-containing protein [Deltaproteobacteria bacterium]
MDFETAFSTLRVDSDASLEEIREAYVKLVRRYPPEQFPEKFLLVKLAYEKLTLHDDLLEDMYQAALQNSTPRKFLAYFFSPYVRQPDALEDLSSLRASVRPVPSDPRELFASLASGLCENGKPAQLRAPATPKFKKP